MVLLLEIWRRQILLFIIIYYYIIMTSTYVIGGISSVALIVNLYINLTLHINSTPHYIVHYSTIFDYSFNGQPNTKT